MNANLALLFGILAAGLFIYMTIWFGFAYYIKRVDAIDSAWGLGFVYVAVIALFSIANFHWFQLLALILTIIWGVRLTAHITLRNVKKAEDSRYQAYREKWGKDFWPNIYPRIFLLQGLLILAISTPVIAVLGSIQSNFNGLAIAGFVVWASGILTEAAADWQLRQFLKKLKSESEIMQSGLWRYSRHPNYFGESATWLGAALVAASIGRWWGFIGFLVITILVTKVSGIPLLEKHYKNNKAYRGYVKRTSIFIPLPPKKVVN